MLILSVPNASCALHLISTFFNVIITGRIIHALACSFFRNSIKLLSFKILYNTLNWINTFNFKLLLKIIIKKK